MTATTEPTTKVYTAFSKQAGEPVIAPALMREET